MWRSVINKDIEYMQLALQEAREAFILQEVPVGAIAVYENRVIAKAHNKRESSEDIFSHAEIICLRLVNKIFENWRANGVTIYSTMEPCLMCLGALLQARVERVVWGAPSTLSSGYEDRIIAEYPFHKMKVEKFCLQEESKELLERFFKQLR